MLIHHVVFKPGYRDAVAGVASRHDELSSKAYELKLSDDVADPETPLASTVVENQSGGTPVTAAPSGTTVANGLIAFASKRDGNVEIYTMDASGNNQTVVNSVPGIAPGTQSWQPLFVPR